MCELYIQRLLDSFAASPGFTPSLVHVFLYPNLLVFFSIHANLCIVRFFFFNQIYFMLFWGNALCFDTTALYIDWSSV